ncbi:hypothetical protein R9C00_26540 [Flammeovirgaceae bacterium SG7u.111]|nr:hypothetical protein [Flammeovirgaceae bacterium SG7u.132]WPO35258.1 hypothetical protein R9C00_26540 [Flammeovirgaceae bacterium SG7u.111]
MGNFWTGARKTLKVLQGKTNTAIESGKLHLEINQLNGRIGGVYKEIGEYVNKKNEEGYRELPLSDDFISEKLNEVKYYKKKIEELRLQNEDLFTNEKKSSSGTESPNEEEAKAE